MQRGNYGTMAAVWCANGDGIWNCVMVDAGGVVRSEDRSVAVWLTARCDAASGCLQLLQVLLDPIAVEGPEGIAQIVEEFEHGQRLLRGPSGRDENADRQWCGTRGHGLAPRRWRARRSVRSRASLRR